MADYGSIFESEHRDDHNLRELVRREIDAIRFQGTGGISVTAKDRRVIISGKSTTAVQAETTTNATPASSHPFKVTNASNATDGVRVHVSPGTVESSYEWSGPPSNMTIPETAPLYFAVAASGKVCLKTTVAAGATDADPPEVTGCVIEWHAGFPPADSATVAYLVIADVTFDTGAITDIYQRITSNLLHGLSYVPYSFPDYWQQRIGPASPSVT